MCFLKLKLLCQKFAFCRIRDVMSIQHYRLLRGAEEVGIRKPVKKEFGGGQKEFVYEDQAFFDGVEDTSSFFTSQERQSIVRHMLLNLRAHHGDQLNTRIRFAEGQAIGWYSIFVDYRPSFGTPIYLVRIPVFIEGLLILFALVMYASDSSSSSVDVKKDSGASASATPQRRPVAPAT